MGAKYYPFMNGKFEIAAGLKPFGTDFSNGELDQKAIQIDEEYKKYIDNKKECRKENIHKYCCFHNFDSASKDVCDFLIERLIAEYPKEFLLSEEKLGFFRLECRLNKEILFFNSEGGILPQSSGNYLNLFDALCSQIQEDVAVINILPEEKKNYLSAIHLCAAGHWAAEDKIGKDFFATHAPVPHIEKINERAQQFAETMVYKGPFVRFVWGFATDTRLNHHPVAPAGINKEEWHGRSFSDPTRDKLFVRVERQVTWGLPKSHLAIFFIRVSYLDGAEILKDPEKAQKLWQSIESMSPELKVYKGVGTSFEVLKSYLNASQ